MEKALLVQLASAAYEHHANVPPIVVAATEVDDSTGRQRSTADFLPEVTSEWATRSVATEVWAQTTTESLKQGPVLGMPPWGRTVTAGRPGQLQDQLVVDVRPAGPSSTFGFIVPATTFTSDSSGVFRQEFRSIWHPVLVLYSTGGLMGVHAAYNFVFMLARPVGLEEPTKFFRVPTGVEEDADGVLEDFHRLLKRSGGRGKHGFVLRELPSRPASLGFDALDPLIHRQREELADFGSATRLGDLFSVVPALRPAAAVSQAGEVSADAGVRLLRGRDLSPDGTITTADQDSSYVDPPSASLLEVGDLVLRRFHAATNRRTLVVGIVGAEDLPAVADRSIIALRPRHPIAEAHLRLLLLFLQSPSTKRLVHADTHRSGQTVRESGLLDVVVPEPDSALSDAIEDLASAAKQFEEWSAGAQELLRSAIDEGSPSTARVRLIEEGRAIRLRVEAGALIDDFGSRVRTRFPYPLAYRWRTVEALASGPDLRATHEAVLETFEVLLCYGAMLAHVMARTAGISLGATTAIRQKLASGSSGPGLGDWVAVLDEVATSKAIAKLPSETPLIELRYLLADSVQGARRRLTERRLAQAHLRRVTHDEFAAQVSEELSDLQTMFSQAAFLTDLPLLHLEQVHHDTISGTTSLTYRQLMGDHPIVPFRRMTAERSDLEAGSLYVMDARQGLHLLRPFLIGRDCPHCNTWSTFHVDRRAQRLLTIKSLEHGHTLDAPELLPPLTSVGLV